MGRPPADGVDVYPQTSLKPCPGLFQQSSAMGLPHRFLSAMLRAPDRVIEHGLVRIFGLELQPVRAQMPFNVGGW